MAVQTHLSFLEECPIAYRGLELLATAVVLLSERRRIRYANPAAENLFELSRRQLVGHSAASVFGDTPALFQAIDKAVTNGASYTEQELEIGILAKPRLHLSCTVSVVDTSGAVLLLEFRHIDQQLKIAREERLLEQQQANRELIRSLAHEIKNPLGGIRGAAQLLEREASYQFPIRLLLFEQAFLARDLELLVDMAEFEQQRDPDRVDHRNSTGQVQ